MITKQQNLLTNGQVKEVDNMNTELHNLFKKGFIETKEDAKLFLNNKAVSAAYEHEGEKVEDYVVYLFNTIDYFAKVTGKVLGDEMNGDRKVDILNQPIKFYGPDTNENTYEELLKMKKTEDEITDIRQDTCSLLDNIVIKGRIDTQYEAYIFMANAKSVYPKSVNLKKGLRENVFRVSIAGEGLFYCEFTAWQKVDAKKNIIGYDFVPGNIRYYTPEGEVNSFEKICAKMQEYERWMTV